MTKTPSTLAGFIYLGEQHLREAGLAYGHGTDNALDEALWLACHAIGETPPLSEARLARQLTEMEQQALAALIRLRIDTRRPAAYLTRKAWFAGLDFHIDERVLVPRSPIAELIDNTFQPWLESGEVRRVLDIGTGSGCIGIACAHAFPGARVDLTDISPAALAVAGKNIRHHGLEWRVSAIESDVFEALGDNRYDLIISNPPYVGRSEWAALPAEYHHEPEVGLLADDNGLALVERILRGASEHLQAQGLLVVEVGNGAAELEAHYPRAPFVWPVFERGGHGVLLLDAVDCRVHFGGD